MRLADGKRQRAPLRGNLDAIRDGSIERVEPFVHGGSHHAAIERIGDFVAFAGIERPQFLDSDFQIAGLRADLAGDFRSVAFVLRPPSGAGRRRQGRWCLATAVSTRRSPACCGKRSR